MKFNKLVILALFFSLTACGTLDSIFPDRKKEYKETGTIPPLEIPPDLSTSSIEDALPIPGETISVQKKHSQQKKANGVLANARASVDSPYSKLIVASSGQPAHIRIHDRFASAWRATGKSLAKLRIEVEDRNRSLGVYYIRYAEGAVNEEGGFFSSLAFWRDEPAVEEKEFRLKLLQSGSETILQVWDKEGQPQSQGAGLELLGKLQKQLKSF